MFMHIRRLSSIAGVLVTSQIALAASAHASSLWVFNAGMLSMFQSSTNQCFLYAYDHNGNRLSRNNLTFSSTGTWGSSTYGCFNWSP